MSEVEVRCSLVVVKIKSWFDSLSSWDEISSSPVSSRKSANEMAGILVVGTRFSKFDKVSWSFSVSGIVRTTSVKDAFGPFENICDISVVNDPL